MIKNFEIIITESSDSFFKCYLDNNRIIDISFYAFFPFIGEKDTNLRDYVEKFDEWEKAVVDLVELNYDFLPNLVKYINQFNEEEMEIFTYEEDDSTEILN